MVGLRKGRGRPKKSWGEEISLDMTELQLTEDMTLIGGCGGRVLD